MDKVTTRVGLLTPYLLRRRLDVARPFLSGRVLDVGCNVGSLTPLVPPDRYLGVDIDTDVLDEARALHPEHRFESTEAVDPSEQFDTVAALAVIEHVSDPEAWLRQWSSHLRPEGRVVLTTPHARWEPLHGFAAKLRLTSVDAHDEHESVLDRSQFEDLMSTVGLRPVVYRRFLAGMNQLMVAER
jgi:2-polyprenyl-3-methyl-5-hydroxy-6-metoxy-1,4-benzoquinol methylase